jgi:cellulose synthase/poly-beta-1,6-N-acetylglucosamine synthase-like glycosyltransferase
MFELLATLFSGIWPGFSQWLTTITLPIFIWMFWPLLIIDAIRAFGKDVVLVIDWLLRRLKKPDPREETYPSLSIIIPAHNEETAIKRSIDSVLAAVYPVKEIIVVDDGSTDTTYTLAKEYSDQGLIKLLHRDKAGGSKAGAVNYGMTYASGEIIIPLDADTLVERGAFTELLRPFKNPEVNAVAGNVRILEGDNGSHNLLVRLQSYEYLQALELGRRYTSMLGTTLLISGAFGAFRKADLVSLGEYGTDTITEDIEATFKMRKLRKKIAFADKAVAWTIVPETWKAWKRQRLRWTRGQLETLLKHRNVLRGGDLDISFVVAVYDMILIDIVLLFVRTLWMPVLILQNPTTYLYITALMFIIYLIIEASQIIVAGLLSTMKSDLEKIYLAPVMVFIYRPYYSFLRLYAYVEKMIGVGRQW